VSLYKTIIWALFGLIFVSIYLLYNSLVFTVDYSGLEWLMAIISESLLYGAPYFLLGAALTLDGIYCARVKYSNDRNGYEQYEFGINYFDF
jgi:hypothetical protein